MTREEAKQRLAAARLPLLDDEDREGLLMEWTLPIPDEEELDGLPHDLREALLNGEEIEDAALPKYDHLVIEAIQQELRGVRNEYLQAQLEALGVESGPVEGEPEVLEPCPCCGYRTIEIKQCYEVCPVCYWCDDEVEDPEEFSEENDMTLHQARENFARLGIMDDSILEFRVEEPEKVYYR